MNFSKEQKAFVIAWIDQQFSTNQLFPCNCAIEQEGEPHVCASHMLAYKAWTKTPHLCTHVSAWIDEWLNSAERGLLQHALQAQAGEAIDPA